MKAVFSTIALRPLLIVLLGLLAGLALPASAQVDTWRDDFSTAAWDEDTGTQGFSGPWTANFPFTDTTRINRTVIPGELRLQNTATLTRSLDLSAYESATIAFRVRELGTLENADRLVIEVAGVPGGPFTAIRTFIDDQVAAGVSETLAIPAALLTATTTVRLRVLSTTGSEFWVVDFVEIRASMRPGCFVDNFGGASLNSANWLVSSVSGGFGAPRTVGRRLRLTDRSNDVSTAASLLRTFPGANNRVRWSSIFSPTTGPVPMASP